LSRYIFRLGTDSSAWPQNNGMDSPFKDGIECAKLDD